MRGLTAGSSMSKVSLPETGHPGNDGQDAISGERIGCGVRLLDCRRRSAALRYVGSAPGA